MIWFLLPYLGNAFQVHLFGLLLPSLLLSVGHKYPRFRKIITCILSRSFLIKKTLSTILWLLLYRGTEKVLQNFVENYYKPVALQLRKHLHKFPILSRLPIITTGIMMRGSYAKFYT